MSEWIEIGEVKIENFSFKFDDFDADAVASAFRIASHGRMYVAPVPRWLGPWRIERWAHGFTWHRDRIDERGLRCVETVTRFLVPEPKPKFANVIRVERDGYECKLSIDGEVFPWYVSEDGVQVHVGRDECPAATFTVLAERLELVDVL